MTVLQTVALDHLATRPKKSSDMISYFINSMRFEILEHMINANLSERISNRIQCFLENSFNGQIHCVFYVANFMSDQLFCRCLFVGKRRLWLVQIVRFRDWERSQIDQAIIYVFWCPGPDLNRHELLAHNILSVACIPFHHPGLF